MPWHVKDKVKDKPVIRLEGGDGGERHPSTGSCEQAPWMLPTALFCSTAADK